MPKTAVVVDVNLHKHFDAIRLTNNESQRPEGWSTVPEIQDHAAFVYLKTVSVPTLNRLVRLKYAEKKANLYRVTNGGILFFDTQLYGAFADPIPPTQPPYEPPPGQDGVPGQDGYPDDQGPNEPPPEGDMDNDGIPDKSDDWDDRKGPRPDDDKYLSRGAPGVGGIPAPIPIGGITEGVIKNIM